MWPQCLHEVLIGTADIQGEHHFGDLAEEHWSRLGREIIIYQFPFNNLLSIHLGVYSRVIKYYAAKQLKRQHWRYPKIRRIPELPDPTLRMQLKELLLNQFSHFFNSLPLLFFSPPFVLSICQDFAKHSMGNLCVSAQTPMYVWLRGNAITVTQLIRSVSRSSSLAAVFLSLSHFLSTTRDRPRSAGSETINSLSR